MAEVTLTWCNIERFLAEESFRFGVISGSLLICILGTRLMAPELC